MCALKSSFERKWLVNVCCKNDDEMRWILLAFQDWKQKTYETIMCLFDLASLFCNIWKYYKKGMPFIRDVITIILKLLVILCPGGKLIKWNDMKILTTMTIQSFQYRKIFSWLNFDPFRKSIKINPFYEFVCPSYDFRAVKKIHDFFNLILKNVFGGLYLQNRNKKSADIFTVFTPKNVLLTFIENRKLHGKSKIRRKIEHCRKSTTTENRNLRKIENGR